MQYKKTNEQIAAAYQIQMDLQELVVAINCATQINDSFSQLKGPNKNIQRKRLAQTVVHLLDSAGIHPAIAHTFHDFLEQEPLLEELPTKTHFRSSKAKLLRYDKASLTYQRNLRPGYPLHFGYACRGYHDYLQSFQPNKQINDMPRLRLTKAVEAYTLYRGLVMDAFRMYSYNHLELFKTKDAVPAPTYFGLPFSICEFLAVATSVRDGIALAKKCPHCQQQYYIIPDTRKYMRDCPHCDSLNALKKAKTILPETSRPKTSFRPLGGSNCVGVGQLAIAS